MLKGCADKGETPSGMWVVPHPSFEVGRMCIHTLLSILKNVLF